MKPLFPVLFCVVMASSLAARAAPVGITSKKITLELRQARLFQLFRLMGDIANLNVVPDACVKDEEIDLTLKNTPVNTVFDILASRLALTYRLEDNVLQVGCASAGDTLTLTQDARLQGKITLELKEVRVEEALGLVAQLGGFQGVQCKGGCDTKVTLQLQSVRVRTVLAVLGDMSGLRFSVVDDVLTAQSGESNTP